MVVEIPVSKMKLRVSEPLILTGRMIRLFINLKCRVCDFCLGFSYI